MFYPLASSSWDHAEQEAMARVIASGRFTMGPEVRAFEEAFARHFGAKHAVMVSSGSAANLLGLASAMHHPDLKWQDGDEIIVPAVSWSTTYFPVNQCGLKLRFVDIDESSLNIDLNQIEDAITPRTKAVFAVNLLGNPVDLIRLRQICDAHDLQLIEDNRESMGAGLNGRLAGSFGLFGTFSCFFSHHISTMEGGLVLTDDRKLYDIMLAMRAHGWTRDLPEDTHLPREPDPFLRQFRFVLPGYNLRPLELSGAIGQAQLAKLPALVEGRRKNARVFIGAFKNHAHVDIQQTTGDPSWFGFALILKGKLAGQRAKLVEALAQAEIECRPIVAGNFLNNPVIEKLDYSVGSPIIAAERIDREGLFTGNSHEDLGPQIAKLKQVVDQTVAKL